MRCGSFAQSSAPLPIPVPPVRSYSARSATSSGPADRSEVLGEERPARRRGHVPAEIEIAAGRPELHQELGGDAPPDRLDLDDDEPQHRPRAGPDRLGEPGDGPFEPRAEARLDGRVEGTLDVRLQPDLLGESGEPVREQDLISPEHALGIEQGVAILPEDGPQPGGGHLVAVQRLNPGDERGPARRIARPRAVEGGDHAREERPELLEHREVSGRDLLTDRGHRVADGVDDVHVDLDQGARQAEP